MGGGRKLRADIRLTGIVDWVLENESGKELLRLKFQHPNVVYFLPQLRPHRQFGMGHPMGLGSLTTAYPTRAKATRAGNAGR